MSKEQSGPSGFQMQDEPKIESAARIDFATFVLSLSTSTMMHMRVVPEGAEEPPGDGPEPNLELARQTIDILDMIEEKTRGNLSYSERELAHRELTWAFARSLHIRAIESRVFLPGDPDAQTSATWATLHGFVQLALSQRLPSPAAEHPIRLTALRDAVIESRLRGLLCDPAKGSGSGCS